MSLNFLAELLVEEIEMAVNVFRTEKVIEDGDEDWKRLFYDITYCPQYLTSSTLIYYFIDFSSFEII